MKSTNHFPFSLQGGFFVDEEDPETSSYFQPTGNPFNKDVSWIISILYVSQRLICMDGLT